MTTSLDHTRTDAALRRLDPAGPLRSSSSQARAAALLDRILATDPEAGRGAPGLGDFAEMDSARLALLTPSPPRRGLRRVALASVAAAVLTAGAIVLPGRSPDYAYADWTATPTSVTDHDATRAAAACRESVGSVGDGGDGPSFPASQLATRLVERRGAWVLALLSARTAENYTWDASCIVHLPAGGEGSPVVVDWGGSGGGGWPEPPGAQLTLGGVSEFGPTSSIDALIRGVPRHSETFSTTNGQVGPDVVGVTIHAGGRTVQASVADGTYAAWWPGPAFDHSTPSAPIGDGGPDPALTYDLTLRDGTVRRDATPTHG
jgi:hypothetical protein